MMARGISKPGEYATTSFPRTAPPPLIAETMPEVPRNRRQSSEPVGVPAPRRFDVQTVAVGGAA